MLTGVYENKAKPDPNMLSHMRNIPSKQFLIFFVFTTPYYRGCTSCTVFILMALSQSLLYVLLRITTTKGRIDRGYKHFKLAIVFNDSEFIVPEKNVNGGKLSLTFGC
jgi:hypothetical protein